MKLKIKIITTIITAKILKQNNPHRKKQKFYFQFNFFVFDFHV